MIVRFARVDRVYSFNGKSEGLFPKTFEVEAVVEFAVEFDYNS